MNLKGILLLRLKQVAREMQVPNIQDVRHDLVGFDIFAPTKQQLKDCKVWRENWQSVMFFTEYCGTQWVYVGVPAGMGGGALLATGLNHASALASLRTLRLPKARFDEVYTDVRVMERAALESINSKNVKPSGH